jgi:hypothetical protein
VVLFFALPGRHGWARTGGNTKNRQGIELIRQNSSSLIIEYHLPPMSFDTLVIDGESMMSVSVAGMLLFNDAGAPNLPGEARYIAIPRGSEAVLRTSFEKTEIIKNIAIAPAPVLPLENDTMPLVYHKNPGIYERDTGYPLEPVRLSRPFRIRGVDVVLLGVTPFQYNPVARELRIFRDIRIEITFSGGNGQFGDPKYRSRWWDPLLQDAILNAASLPEVVYSVKKNGKTTGCEYLILTRDDPDFLKWADSIRIFRTRQGISTKVLSITEATVNRSWEIDKFFEEIYYNWDIPPSAVLLLGDYANDDQGITSGHQVHVTSGSYVTDNFFADVDGDHLPDIAVSRIPAQDTNQLKKIVSKILDYERDPPENPNYYSHPVTAMGWETSRWFQLCSEVINGFWEHGLGKSPVRENAIFSGTPGGVWSTAPNTDEVVDYFGPQGCGYIPDNTAHLTDWGGSAERINNDINNGAFMLQHRDHGFEIGWGEPSYKTWDLPGLFNDGLTFVFSVNCLTGRFNWSNECFAEAFLRHNFGALGVIAASEESYSFVNDTYVWGMYDYMWPQFMPTFGSNPVSRGILPAFANVAGKYFLQQSDWPYNSTDKQITYDLFHHFGESFSTVYTEVPQHFTVVHDSVLLCTADHFMVTADSSALIALSYDNEVLGTATGTGSPVAVGIPIQMPGRKILLTVTGQNFFRYEKIIGVVAPPGAYVMAYSCAVNDSLGDNNKKADAGEQIFITLTMKNAGDEPASGVTVKLGLDDPYIALTDSLAFYGDMMPGEWVSVTNAFAMQVSGDTPDGHLVEMNVIAGDGSSTWWSPYTIPVSASVLSLEGYRVGDALLGNNDGFLQPGESCQLLIRVRNSGSGKTYGVSGSLTSSSPYLQVINSGCLLDTVEAQSVAHLFYDVQLDTLTPQGLPVGIQATLASFNQTLADTFTLLCGARIEDWELKNFDRFDWQPGGDKPWGFSASEKWEGTFSAQSGFVIDDESSALSLVYIVATDDSVSFYRKVSSESGWDFLEFYIDTVKAGEWSGEEDWARVSHPVGAGPHLFKWQYSKDMFVSEGMDRAWLDNIILPPSPAVYAGPDGAACEGGSFPLNGKADYFTSLEWTTTGSGSFSNPGVLSPVYYPDSLDAIQGHVRLCLTNHHPFGQMTDTLVLHVNPLPWKPSSPTGSTLVCQGDSSSTYHTGQIGNATSLLWLVEPDSAAQLEAAGDSCQAFWNNSFYGTAFISIAGINDCGEGLPSDPLAVYLDQLPQVSLQPFDTVCLNEPPFVITGGLPAGGQYTGPGVFNGVFYPVVAGPGSHQITYTCTTLFGCANSDDENLVVDACTAIRETPQSDYIRIFPNPADNRVNLVLHASHPDLVCISIQGLHAGTIYREDFIEVEGDLRREIRTDSWPPGLYIIRLQGNRLNICERMVISR